MKKLLILLIIIIMASCKVDKPMPHFQTKFHSDKPLKINPNE